MSATVKLRQRRPELFTTFDAACVFADHQGRTRVVDAGQWFATIPYEWHARDAEREVARLVIGRQYAELED